MRASIDFNNSQQQESTGFLGPRATRSCRFCDADTGNRDLDRDTISHGRYHHQILALREAAASVPVQTHEKEIFL